jgi:hypothetical protein
MKLALVLLATLLAQPAAFAQGKAPAKTPAAAKGPAMIPGTVGKGPLTLTSSAAATYQEYLAHACPLVLVADAAGWVTHAALGPRESCPAAEAALTQATIRGALNTCNTFANNPPCSVVAIGRKVVWDGPISFLPSRYTPQGGNQYAIVLRRILADGETSSAFETTAGLITYAADGRSASLLFKKHDELGLCRGGVAFAEGAGGTVALTCTKAGAVAGTLALNPDGRTGSGTAAGEQRRFEMTVLPHAEFLAEFRAEFPAGRPEKPQPAPGAETPKPERNGASS